MQEMITTAVFIAIFVIFFSKIYAVQGLVGSHPEVMHPAGANAFDGHLDVGCHARRGLEFRARDETDVAIVTDGVSFAKIDNRSGCHRDGEPGAFWPGCQARNREKFAICLKTYGE